MLDLMVHHRTNMVGIHDDSHENDLAYHYQSAVAHLNGPGWSHITINLDHQIQGATARFGLDRAATGLEIHQLEFVVEVHNAYGAVAIDNMALTTRETALESIPPRGD